MSSIRESVSGSIEEMHYKIECELGKRLEEIEGRVPTIAEVYAHGRREILVETGETRFFWRGQKIVHVHPPVYDGQRVYWRIEVHRP